jgi:hypothetical protein
VQLPTCSIRFLGFVYSLRRVVEIVFLFSRILAGLRPVFLRGRQLLLAAFSDSHVAKEHNTFQMQ